MISEDDKRVIKGLLVSNVGKYVTVINLLEEYNNMIGDFDPRSKGVVSFYDYLQKMPDIVKIITPELINNSPIRLTVPYEVKHIEETVLTQKSEKNKRKRNQHYSEAFPSVEIVRDTIKKINDSRIHGLKITYFNDYMTKLFKCRHTWILKYAIKDLDDLLYIKSGRVFLKHMATNVKATVENSVRNNGNCDKWEEENWDIEVDDNKQTEDSINVLEVTPANCVHVVMKADKFLKHMLDPVMTLKFDKYCKKPMGLIKINSLEKVTDNFLRLLRACSDGLPISRFLRLYKSNFGKLCTDLYGWSNVYDILAHLPSIFRYDSSANGQLRLFEATCDINQFIVPQYTKLKIFLLLRDCHMITIEMLFLKYKEKFGEELNLSEYGFENKFQFVWALSDFMKVWLYEKNQFYVGLKDLNILNRDWLYGSDVFKRLSVANSLQFRECDVKLKVLPLPNVNDEITMVMCTVYSVEHFFLVPEKYYSELYDLMHQMRLYFEQQNREKEMNPGINPGALCAWKDVKRSIYNRCRILRIINENSVELFDVDDGFMFTGYKRDLLSLPDKFLNLPELAIRAKLYEIDDLGYSKIFANLFVANKIVTAVVVQVDDEKRILTCKLKRRDLNGNAENIVDVLKQRYQPTMELDDDFIRWSETGINPYVSDVDTTDDNSDEKRETSFDLQNRTTRITNSRNGSHMQQLLQSSNQKTTASRSVSLWDDPHSSLTSTQVADQNQTIPTGSDNKSQLKCLQAGSHISPQSQELDLSDLKHNVGKQLLGENPSILYDNAVLSTCISRASRDANKSFPNISLQSSHSQNMFDVHYYGHNDRNVNESLANVTKDISNKKCKVPLDLQNKTAKNTDSSQNMINVFSGVHNSGTGIYDLVDITDDDVKCETSFDLQNRTTRITNRRNESHMQQFLQSSNQKNTATNFSSNVSLWDDQHSSLISTQVADQNQTIPTGSNNKSQLKCLQPNSHISSQSQELDLSDLTYKLANKLLEENPSILYDNIIPSTCISRVCRDVIKSLSTVSSLQSSHSQNMFNVHYYGHNDRNVNASLMNATKDKSKKKCKVPLDPQNKTVSNTDSSQNMINVSNSVHNSGTGIYDLDDIEVIPDSWWTKHLSKKKHSRP